MSITMDKINNINSVANSATETSNGFNYTIGMEIGLMDSISMTKEDVEWFTLGAIETDSDLPIAFFYLVSNEDHKNIHEKCLNINGNMTLLKYAEIVDSINDYIVVP